jgi:hypothetical protein
MVWGKLEPPERAPALLLQMRAALYGQIEVSIQFWPS